MDLDELNDTELVLVAQDVAAEAHRGYARTDLIEMIEAGEDIELRPRNVNKVRLQIMEYITDRWTQVEPLLSCPASTKDPRACFQCTDIQVVECATTNPEIFKREKEETT
jgi:hypothetical protein